VNNGQKKKRNMQVRFIDRLEDLKAYKEKNGHLNVRERDDKSLYIWCINIRCARRGTGNMKLTADGIAALDAIGFDWKSEANKKDTNKCFQDRVKALVEYKERNGHLCVSKKDNKSLFYWCAHTRSAQRNPESCKRKLTADRIATLDAVGFDWRSEIAIPISFIDWVEALRAYKEKHGHLSISKKDDKSLYKWCMNIRCAKSGEGTMKLTHLHIAALDSIGFDWRLSKSVLQPFDSLGDDADDACGKSEENHKTVQNCQFVGDGFHRDDLEHVEIPNAKVTFQEISIDSLTEEEKIMFDAIECSIFAAKELTMATIK
jgi:hypothetical protein